MTIVFSLFGITVLFLAVAAAWLGATLKWIDEKTIEDRFFQLPRAERIVSVMVLPLAKLGLRLPVTDFEGTKVPGICPTEAMQFAKDYAPQKEDVFVATQMKCGTTWMQQIVHHILTKGAGDFSDEGHRHLDAISPWIESRGSVRLENAPLIKGRRIIKTHLGTNLCPYSTEAKFIYVVRHPAACLASSVDFVSMLMGPMAPQYNKFCDWFCSDDMWWRSWPEHVEGWWPWSQERDNVLFVHYEELLESPAEKMLEIAVFLGVELSAKELANAIAASKLDWSLQSLGFGGQCHLDPFVARTMAQSDADILSIKAGINIVNMDSMRERILGPLLHGSLDTIRERKPDAPIIVMSPIYCPSAEQHPGPTVPDESGKFAVIAGHEAVRKESLTLTRIRTLMTELVRGRRDPNLHFIDGLSLFGEADADDLPDDLHPSPAGYIRMGNRFAALAAGLPLTLRPY